MTSIWSNAWPGRLVMVGVALIVAEVVASGVIIISSVGVGVI